MRQTTLLIRALILAASLPFAARLSAQNFSASATETLATDSGSVSKHSYDRLLHYPWSGVSMWAGASVDTRNASHNDQFDGSFRIVGLQITRDILRSRHFRLTYVGEVLPAILIHSGAPANRMPLTGAHPWLLHDPARIARYAYHDSYGFGLAPFGGEASIRIARQLSLVINTTVGAVLFNKVVPYGDATKANFTVSPGAELQWEAFSHAGVAAGYTMHHLSNATLGKSNPGMNSHIFLIRLTRLGARYPM